MQRDFNYYKVVNISLDITTLVWRKWKNSSYDSNVDVICSWRDYSFGINPTNGSNSRLHCVDEYRLVHSCGVRICSLHVQGKVLQLTQLDHSSDNFIMSLSQYQETQRQTYITRSNQIILQHLQALVRLWKFGQAMNDAEEHLMFKGGWPVSRNWQRINTLSWCFLSWDAFWVITRLWLQR